MHKLSSAFEKHDPQRFSEWVKSLATGAAKVNAGQLFPHEIIYAMTKSASSDTAQHLLFEAQFAELIKKYSADGMFSNTLAVCDVSGSMSNSRSSTGANTPINVCIGLGLIIAALTEQPFTGKVITFSNNPVYVDLSKCKSLYEKLNMLKNAQWGMNTDLQKVFDLILSTARSENIMQQDMPRRIIIISDMQFDMAQQGHTNYDVVREQYRQCGYELPTIVFWNVNAKYSDFPISATDKGILISGYGPSILKYIYQDKLTTPLDVLNEVLYAERYLPIRNVFAPVIN
jgi:hypothetical protein